MKRSLGWCLVWGVVAATVACGDDDGPSCPPEYPVLRDGFCYTAGDAAVRAPDAGVGDASTDAATEADMTLTSDGGSTDAGECVGEHPLVDGDRRYCEPGACYCAEADSCLPEADAVGCCAGSPDCGGEPDAGTCEGTHPLVDGDRRYCEAGDCYCATPDNCYPAASAVACCSVDPVCDS
jgi:hypothetical protein